MPASISVQPGSAVLPNERWTVRSSSSPRRARGGRRSRSRGAFFARRARGVRFDEMAILVRSPQHYFGLIEHALRRAKVPAWFSRGTRRPLTRRPGVPGAAGLRLRTSVRLAIRRVPVVRAGAARERERRRRAGPRRRTRRSAASQPSVGGERRSNPEAAESRGRESRIPDPESESVLAGTLRAPWRWEALIVDAAVIGRDATRWTRRLEGKHAELERQIREAKRDDGGDEARVAGLRQVQRQLEYLKAFALPIIEELAGWPAIGDVGRMARSVRGAGAARARRRRPTSCGCSPIFVRWARSARSISTKRAACSPSGC